MIIKQLAEIRSELRAGRPVPPTTVRTFLEWFEARRRGFYVVQRIREQLEEASIDTIPDFETAWVDAPIGFILLVENNSETHEDAEIIADTPVLEEQSDDSAGGLSSQYQDPTYKVSKLPVATQNIISVKPDDTLAKAITVMMASSISQLPVMSTDREVKGMITWRTLALRQTLGPIGNFAKEFMEPHHEVRQDSSLFEAIPIIVKHDYVLVRAHDNRISGIITSSDLSSQFRNMTEPFLLLSEIENIVRNLISGRFKLSELVDACNPEPKRKIVSAADLNFGEYVFLLQEPSRWNQFALKVDRQIFCDRLDLVREIRNDVMHFRPAGIKGEDLESLRDFAGFLKNIAALSSLS